MILALAAVHLALVIFLSVKEIRYIRSWRALPVAPKMAPEPPLVSVLIPARNEEKAIGESVQSLLAQTYPSLEIIVIDDESTDQTAAIVEELAKTDSRLKLLRGQPITPEWVGKCHALTQGVSLAKGTWLLFTDADVIHAPESVSSAMTYAMNHRVDLLTLKFAKICVGFWEKVVIPYVYFIKGWFAPTPAQILDPLCPKATATGDFILFRRQAYESFGGHAHPQVKSYVVEDAAIARVAKKAGLKLETYDAGHLIKVRKFLSLRELWYGFGKIIYAEYCKSSVFRLLIQCILLGLYSIAPYFWLVFSIIFGGVQMLVLSAVMLGCAVVTVTIYHKSESQPLAWVFLHPLGSLLFIGISLHSGYQAKTKRGIHWRQRHYQPRTDWGAP